ncbi:hypothetical protein RRSWK_06873 [Rhodopirellula sp. SWK7]|nr:hypothetical protein RRSWK_06873 [Rhodopirellula sp. SWK7]
MATDAFPDTIRSLTRQRPSALFAESVTFSIILTPQAPSHERI